jgi:hypothetical protein
MWMINTEILCRQHLLGEHGELHKHRHNFVKKHKMAGRIGQIEPHSMKSRRDVLVLEMEKRGYTHQSPYSQPDISYLPEMQVDKSLSLEDLLSRCENCKKRYENLKERL